MHDFTTRRKMVKLYQWLESQQNVYSAQNDRDKAYYYFCQKSFLGGAIESGNILSNKARKDISILFVDYAKYLISEGDPKKLSTLNKSLQAGYKFFPQNECIKKIYHSYRLPDNYPTLVKNTSEEIEFYLEKHNTKTESQEHIQTQLLKIYFFSMKIIEQLHGHLILLQKRLIYHFNI
jgi:hypothetical protein